MKPEEMRDDIPADVREALAEALRYIADMPYHARETDWLEDQLERAIRVKPATVVIPRAEIPAPLTEVPESGKVWSIHPAAQGGVYRWTHENCIRNVIDLGLAWDTKEKALAALAAFTAREPTRPGDDWTPHTSGDPMPCDGDDIVEIRTRCGNQEGPGLAHEFDWCDDNHPADITAWRYAREASA